MSDKSCLITDTGARREVKKVFVSYRRLKTQKHSVSIGLFILVLLFMNILIGNLLKQFFCIQNCKMCLRKEILYQYFVVFCPVWESFFPDNTLYVIA